MLYFLQEERLKFINVTIVDNLVPELDKIFKVELYNPFGGGETFVRQIMTVKIKTQKVILRIFTVSFEYIFSRARFTCLS